MVGIPSLKLPNCPWKMMVGSWKTWLVSFWDGIFLGGHVMLNFRWLVDAETEERKHPYLSLQASHPIAKQCPSRKGLGRKRAWKQDNLEKYMKIQPHQCLLVNWTLRVFKDFMGSAFPKMFHCHCHCHVVSTKTLPEINISHLRKRWDSSSKLPFLGDMLVPWRVIIWWIPIDSAWILFPSKPSPSRPNSAKILVQSPGVTGDSNRVQMRTPQHKWHQP